MKTTSRHVARTASVLLALIASFALLQERATAQGQTFTPGAVAKTTQGTDSDGNPTETDVDKDGNVVEERTYDKPDPKHKDAPKKLRRKAHFDSYYKPTTEGGKAGVAQMTFYEYADDGDYRKDAITYGVNGTDEKTSTHHDKDGTQKGKPKHYKRKPGGEWEKVP
jgi:hypothetical protein